MTEPPARAKKAEIDHVIVLMLENRSFDNLLGFLDFPGLIPLEVGSHPKPFEVDGLPRKKRPSPRMLNSLFQSTPRIRTRA